MQFSVGVNFQEPRDSKKSMLAQSSHSAMVSTEKLWEKEQTFIQEQVLFELNEFFRMNLLMIIDNC